jgi:hypothetical protein
MSTGHNGLPARIRGWFARLTRIQKLLAATAGLIITLGAVASAITAILDLSDRLAPRNQGNGSGSKTETPVQEETYRIPVKARPPEGPAEGVRVIEVIPGSPADHAGVRVQDIITAVRGRSVEDVDDFRKTLKQARTGTSILLSLLRSSHREYVRVQLQRIVGSDLRLGLRVADIKPQTVAGQAADSRRTGAAGPPAAGPPAPSPRR